MKRASLISIGSLMLAGCMASGGTGVEVDPSESMSAYANDRTPPVLTITHPLRPAFVEGTTLRVEGYVEDESPVEVMIGDAVAAVDESGHFSADIRATPGAHRFRVVARDAAANESFSFVAALMGSYGEATGLVPHAVSLQLGADSMRELSLGTARSLNSMEIEPYITAANPVADESWGSIDVTSVTYRDVSLDIQPGVGQLRVEGTIQDLEIGLYLDSLVNLRGDISAEDVQFTAAVEVTARDGRIVAEVLEQEVTIGGFLTDVEHFPDFIEEWVAGPVGDLVEEKLNEAIAEELPAAVEEGLGDIPSSRLLEVFDTQVEVHFEVSELTITPSGLFIDVAAGALAGAQPVVIDETRPVPGPLRLTDGSAPERVDSPLAADLSLDAINAISFNAWAGQALDFRIDEIPFGTGDATLAVLAFISPELQDVAPLDTPISAEIRMELPPVLMGQGEAVLFRSPDVTVDFVARTSTGEQRVVSMSLGIQAQVGVEIVAGGEPGQVQLALSEMVLTGDLYEGPASFGRGPQLDNILRGLSGPLLDKLSGLEALQIPSVYGFQLAPSHIGHRAGFIHFEGSLTHHLPVEGGE